MERGRRYVRELVERYYIVRISWLYRLGGRNFPEKMSQGTQEKRTVTVVTDEVASPTWTVDLAQGIAKLISQPARGSTT